MTTRRKFIQTTAAGAAGIMMLNPMRLMAQDGGRQIENLGYISGLINTAKPHQKVIGFPSLKGNFLHSEIDKYVINNKNWSLNTEFHFGGYGKVSDEVIQFINNFKTKTNIPLDPIYTGKMMFGIVKLIKSGYFAEGSKILAIHTGGLQGIKGMNNLLKKKNLVRHLPKHTFTK